MERWRDGEIDRWKDFESEIVMRSYTDIYRWKDRDTNR
jgi:hypothetical protein